MPLLTQSTYQRPKWLFNGHLETIYPALFRKVTLEEPVRERIKTPDKDFLDLDWFRKNNSQLTIICHGLEGNSTRPYMLGMAKIFLNNQYDVLTWNYRGCGDELNQNPIFYHSGATYDLEVVIQHALNYYDSINLIGFSLGGNLVLKYLGEKGDSIPELKKGVAISAPLHLSSSSKKISERENTVYSKRFLRTLKKKVIQKAEEHPEQIPLHFLHQIKTLSDFDNAYTGPLHGFSDAEEYYQINSSIHFLEKIQVPTLILNAKNDPFLSDLCYPETLAHQLKKVHFEFPEYGGHVGFTPKNAKDPYYSDQRAFEFIRMDI